MKQRVKTFLVALTLTVVAAVPLLLVGLTGSASAADPTGDAQSQVCATIGTEAGGTCGNGGAELNKIVRAVLNVISVLAGVAAVFMIVISGFKYITSSGESQAVAGAKRTLTYAIVGLAVVALSQTIVHFVLADVK